MKSLDGNGNVAFMRVVFIAILTFLLVPIFASAHGLGIEAKRQGDKIIVEAFFDDDTAAGDADVKVFDSDDRTVAEGKTDAMGRWTFTTLPVGKYRIVVDAGGGHRAKTHLTIVPESNASQVISEGANREEFTGTEKWKRAGLGLLFLSAILGFWALRRHR